MSGIYTNSLTDLIEMAKKELGIDSALHDLAIIMNVDPKDAIANINPKIVERIKSIMKK